jgi:hypothetical protein
MKINKGRKKFQFELFCGKVVATDVDLDVHILGVGGEAFLSYMVALRRKMLSMTKLKDCGGKMVGWVVAS